MVLAVRERNTRLGFLSAAILVGSAFGGFAQEVRLVNEAAGINITGTFVSANQQSYVIDSALGRLNVSRENTNCVGAACPTAEGFEFDLLFAGTDSIVNSLLPVVIDGYAAGYDASVMVTNDFVRLLETDNQALANVSLDVATPTESFEWLADGVVDVIFTDETPNRDQRAMIESAGGGNLRSFERERILAVSGLVVLIHPDNAVPFVTQEQIAAILSGATVNWADVGGPDAPITIYALSEMAEVSGVVARHILNPNNVSLGASVNILASADDIEAAVANDPNGFAVVRFDAGTSAGMLPIQTSCGGVVSPSEFTLKAEEYPLSDRIFAYSHLLQGEFGRAFVDFLDDSKLDSFVAQSDFVDLSLITQDQTDRIATIEAAMLDDGDSYEVSLMADLADQMSDFERASTTLRFRGSSDALDNRGQRDLQRIRGYALDNDIETIALVGYTDGQGDFDANLRIAEDRAQIVADELRRSGRSRAFDDIEITVQGFGSLNPVACNDSAQGRAANRRVEVWFN